MVTKTKKSILLTNSRKGERKMKLFTFLLIAFMSIPLVSLSEANTRLNCKPNEQYYKDKERGWYFKEKCEEIEKKEDKKVKKEEKIDWAKVIDPNYLDSLDAEKFRKLLEKVKDEAVYNPSHEKVLAYMKMQDYMRVKSVKFAYIWRDALLQNPHLDMTVKNPGSNFGSFAKAEVEEERKNKLMAEIKNTVGLFFFISGDCPYCHQQNKIIDILRKKHEVAVRSISNNYCDQDFKDCSVEPFMFENFQIKATPTLVAVLRDSQDRPIFQPLGTGIITLDEIIERLMFYYNFHKTGKYPDF